MHLMWVMQAHHIDTDYYDKFFGPGDYGPAHAAHMANWLRGRSTPCLSTCHAGGDPRFRQRGGPARFCHGHEPSHVLIVGFSEDQLPEPLWHSPKKLFGFNGDAKRHLTA